MKTDELRFPSDEELCERFRSQDYLEKNFAWCIEKLSTLSEPVLHRFISWWWTGAFKDDLKVKGKTIRSFEKELGFDTLTSFIMFNDFLLNPEDPYYQLAFEKKKRVWSGIILDSSSDNQAAIEEADEKTPLNKEKDGQ